jgi:glutathione S-transferase
MKLYYYPAAGSLAPHIALEELGLPYQLDKVDLATRKTETGADYLAINPMGYVPTLQLDNDEVLTETAVILQYLADQKPDAGLLPTGGMARYHALETLNFLAAEVHRLVATLFTPNLHNDARSQLVEHLLRRCAVLAARLERQPYLLGASYSLADAYFFVALGGAGFLKIDLSQLPTLGAYQQRIASRPAVQAALRAEGII